MRRSSSRDNGSYREQQWGLTMRFSGRGQQTGGRRVAASTAQWPVDGSVPGMGSPGLGLDASAGS